MQLAGRNVFNDFCGAQAFFVIPDTPQYGRSSLLGKLSYMGGEFRSR